MLAVMVHAVLMRLVMRDDASNGVERCDARSGDASSVDAYSYGAHCHGAYSEGSHR